MNDIVNQDQQQQLVPVDSELTAIVELARRFPRNAAKAVEAVEERALSSVEMAEKCFYCLPPRRKWNKEKKRSELGAPIMGPSIRLAEIFQGQWGALFTGARPVRIDREDKMVYVEAYALDAEKLVRTSEVVGRRFYGDEPDKQADSIQLAIAAAKSIGIRNCVRRIIGPEVQDVYEKCRVKVELAPKPLERLERALVQFQEEFDVPPELVLEALGIDKKEDVTRRHLTTLVGVYTGLREGTTTVAEVFERVVKPLQPDPGSTGDSKPAPKASDVKAAKAQPKERVRAGDDNPVKPEPETAQDSRQDVRKFRPDELSYMQEILTANTGQIDAWDNLNSEHGITNLNGPLSSDQREACLQFCRGLAAATADAPESETQGELI